MAAKFALIIGNSQYDDSNLSRLKAPDLDVQGLEEVLKSPAIGNFDEVTTLLNESGATVRKAVARFFERRRRDDLLLLYFSGHGVKDEQGHLYLALRDTETALLAGSALETAFITERMDRSFSKQQVLMLDCCHSGAFAEGAKAAQGVSVGTAEAFEGSGLGRVILTATDSTQYAWEGDRVIGDAETSLFTHFLVDGLKTGAADQDDDGVVTIDELYDYVRDHVVNVTPRQTPRKWSYRQDGDLVIAQNPLAKRSKLPPEIEEAKNSKLSTLRLEAVRDLEKLLRGRNAGRSRAALMALKELAQDDSRRVANAASEALKASAHAADIDAGSIDAEATLGNVTDAVVPPPIAARIEAQPAESTPQARQERRENLPSDIFISYEHQDRPKARMLANALMAEGWTVWWDRRIAPGESFDLVIERELASSKCVIVLWTARSVGATWVRNEARRAARRRVLVPLLMETVEPPLEFENLQAADLTTWEANTQHPEFDAVLDRIQALAPRTARMARLAVEHARREFAAGRTHEALASLEQFQPPDPLVTQALEELRAEAQGLESARAEAARQRAEARERQQRLLVAKEHVEELLGLGESDAAEQALAAAEKEFASAQEWRPLRERLNALRATAAERVEHQRLEAAQGEAEAAKQRAAEADRVERERLEAAQRETEAAQQRAAEAERVERERLLEAAQRETEIAKIARDSTPADVKAPGASTASPSHTDHLRQPEDHPLVGVRDDPVESHTTALPALQSRVILAAVAAGLVLLLVAVWMLNGRRPAAPGIVNEPSPQVQPVATSAPEAAAPAPARESRPPATDTDAPLLPSTGTRGFPSARAAVREDRPPHIVPAEVPETKPAPRVSVDELRTRARNQRQTGDRVQALNTAVEGLKLFPKDAGLTAILNSLLADGQAAVTRSKREATSVNAQERAEDMFAAGVQKEREADKLRRSGRTDEATRALWIAADQFRTAADHARQVADEEAAEQRRIEAGAKAGAPTNAPPRNTPAPAGDAKPPDGAVEAALVAKVLRQYEAGYAKLNAAAVRSVYPSAPVEDLTREFAGYRSYTLTVKVHNYDFLHQGDLLWMNVPATVVHVISPKAGATTPFEREQTFQMVKQNGTWIIRQIR